MSLSYAADSAAALHEVHELLGRYFDGLYASDADGLAAVFHPGALYATAADDALTLLSMAQYLPIIAAREAPASRGEQRTDAIESIEFAGPATPWRACGARSGPSDSPTC